MKRIQILSLLLALAATALAQRPAPQWTKILSDQPETFKTQLVSSTENSVKVNVQVPGFYTTTVSTPRGEAHVVTGPKSVSTAQAGEPDLPMTGIPVMIGDRARMKARVLDAQYTDFEGIDVAPSKGDFSRQIDPATVPYTYGSCYSQDAFFPASNLDLYDPYILRDFRGQNMAVYPFAYNPVTKTLRVYHNLTVELYKVDDNGENVLERQRGNEVRLAPDFKSLYQRHFINYEAGMAKYTSVDEEGDLLIICYSSFMSAMTDFVNWKQTRGINTTLVNASSVGSTYSAIKTYIQNQYNANNNLTHVLLVGDVAQIPGYSYSGGGSSYSGLGDNAYGQIVGSDIYNDVFIGRFSASSASQVTNQVQKVITYERDLTTSDSWVQNGLGVSTSESNSGHNSEDDYQHIENLRTDLLNYGYSTVYQDYYNVSGYPTSSTSTISNHINSGVGVINYCNHGSETQWQSHYYSNSHVNALTNSNKLPFIFSVACLNGKYDYSSGDCFAEAWMHATHNSTGAPTGAVGTMMSYISQPWVPPMWAQDEFVDILVESYNNNLKHTWGGCAINGIMAIFDHYSTSTQAAVGTYQAWILYGDPSMMLRTKTPQAMTVSHNGILDVTQTSYVVNVNNGNGALATITDADHNILGKATVSNGTATIPISGTLESGDQLTLCVFGYNKVTYLGTIEVVAGEQYTINVTAQPAEGGTVTGGGDFYENSECTLTATANRGYAFAGWKLSGSIVSTEPTYTFTVTGDATYTACFDALTAHHIEAMPVEHGTFSFSPSPAYTGETVTLTASPETGYQLRAWIVYQSGDMRTTVPVTGSQFVMPDFDVTIAALFVVPTGGDVTVGSGTNSLMYLPSFTNYNYSLSQQIYTAEELTSAGTITAIAFNNSANTAERNFDVYLKHTTKTAFSSNTDWETVSAADKVYSGMVTYAAEGWFTILFDTPFEYDGTSNLIVCVDDNSNAYINGYANAPKCLTYNTGAQRSIRVAKDNPNFDPTSATSLASYTGSRASSNNQIRFTFAIPSENATINVTPASLSGFEYDYGDGPSEPQSLLLLASATTDLAVTAPAHFELSQQEQGPYSGSLTIAAAPVISTNLYVRMKAGLEAGTYTEDLQLQSGETIQTVALSGEVIQTNHYSYNENLYDASMSVFAVIVIDGEEQRTETLETGAFSGDECRGTGKPLYCPPVDRYILPLIVFGESGDPITFQLYDHELAEELDLTCLTTLSFQEDGLGTITDPVVLNFTSESVVTTTQTISLEPGWNWWSCYLETSADLFTALKDAIAESNPSAVIKSQSATIMHQGESWIENPNQPLTLDNESMYMISIDNPVTLTLTAETADPANHTIILAPGWNWIGFVSDTPMTLQEAFSGFTPNSGDLIKSATQSSSYSNNKWDGRLQTLTPGQGYMYQNSGTTDLILSLPVPGKTGNGSKANATSQTAE